jgi:peptidoglycan hydrolase-like protein with peptidoglycan-binding domain
MNNYKIKILLVFLAGMTFFPFFSSADSSGQIQTFFVDTGYALNSKEQVQAVLQKVSANGYFYLENSWYQNLKEEDKKAVDQNLEALSSEFDKTIYPKLTSFFGKEWSPGIDGDYKITILFHEMKEDAMGYFNNADEYPRLQNPKSNEREMVYLSTKALSLANTKSFLAHEFVHLITFNQKDRLRGLQEEIWLNESRAEYAPTYLGYDQEYEGSNLQQRVKLFISSPSNSITEWQGQKNDYGAINLFTQYLVDQYGSNILIDSLQSSKIGIASINEALQKSGFAQNFSQIFTDWTITSYLNNCDFGQKYCYKNTNLKNLKISPSLIFFPSTYKTKFSLDYSINQWSGNWYRIIGGQGKLEINFTGSPLVSFSVPYVLCRDNNDCSVSFLSLDNLQKGAVSFDNFGKEWTSLTLIPSIQSKTSGFSSQEPFYDFSISASMSTETNNGNLTELITKILELQKQIAELQAKINDGSNNQTVCLKIESDLYLGLSNNQEVRCLQEFLKSQGQEIYPEGLVTGNFGPLTKSAVIHFQEKYAAEILTPLGMNSGTGFVGPATRQKINSLLVR